MPKDPKNPKNMSKYSLAKPDKFDRKTNQQTLTELLAKTQAGLKPVRKDKPETVKPTVKMDRKIEGMEMFARSNADDDSNTNTS